MAKVCCIICSHNKTVSLHFHHCKNAFSPKTTACNSVSSDSLCWTRNFATHFIKIFDVHTCTMYTFCLNLAQVFLYERFLMHFNKSYFSMHMSIIQARPRPPWGSKWNLVLGPSIYTNNVVCYDQQSYD